MYNETGGIHAQRGFLSQTYSLLFYYLIRKIEFPELEAVIESGEDASFLYNIPKDGKELRITELVQCKKREESGSNNIHAGAMPDDEWMAGIFDWGDLKKWVEKKRTDQSVIDVLAANSDMYFTAILFGEVGKKVAKFIPSGLEKNVVRWFWSDFSKIFPVSYRHQNDPVLSATFGNQEIRSRIRVLLTVSPSELGVLCRLLLEQYYKVSESLSAMIVKQLRIEIENRGAAKGEKCRILNNDFERIIASGRVDKGKWQSVQDWLRISETTKEIPDGSDVLRWTDFEKGRFAHREEFDSALIALEQDGFVLLSGPAGTGKTTLSAFLAYSFLNKEISRRVAYYLKVGLSSTSLKDEIEFFKTQVFSQALFIVDDQHLAIDEVERLVELFMDYRIEGKSSIKLVITSTRLYTKAQALERGENKSILNQTTSISLILPDKERMQNLIMSLKSVAGLKTPISDNELASLSDGNLGLALILARCAGNVKRSYSLNLLLRDKAFEQTISDWILKQIGREKDYEFFKKEIVPVFIIGSYEIPIPHDFSRAVNELYMAGYLETNERTTDSNPIFNTRNLKLAFIIVEINRQQQFAVLSRYFNNNPKHISILFERLARNNFIRSTFVKLCEIHLNVIVDVLIRPLDPNGLSDSNKVLHSIYIVDRSIAIKLLRKIASPYGQADERFFSKILNLEQVQDVKTLTNFLKTVYSIDRYLMRKLAKEQLGPSHANFILALFRLETCNLDDIAACLRILKLYHREFALELYDTFKSSSSFLEKTVATESDLRVLSIWLRFCEELRSLNRRDCYDFVEKYLPADRVLNAVLQNSEFTTMSLLLLKLHRLHPRLAANICSRMWDEHQHLLLQNINDQKDLIAICYSLYAISRLNKRVSVQVGWRAKDHIQNLISTESNYRRVGSTIESVRKIIGVKLAYDVILAIDQNHILTKVKQEDHHIDLVGKFLYNLTLVSDEVAYWFEERLDYKEFLRNIFAQRLRNLTCLIHGFLSAASVKRKKEMSEKFLNDSELVTSFKHGWNEAANLTEISFCVSLLLSIPLRKSEVYQLLGFPNLASFEKAILQKLACERSILHISNCLFALSKFDFETAYNGLQVYLTRVEQERAKSKPNNKEDDRRLPFSNRTPNLPGEFKPNNLVEIGCLFQIVSAIQPVLAPKLTGFIDLQRFVDYAIDEPNLGRLTVFTYGLHKASYKLSREFISSICNENTWEKQYQENEDIENIIHYARILENVSQVIGQRYIGFILERYQKQVQEVLEIELNLMLISNWLRIIPKGKPDMFQQHINSISQIIIAAIEYDTDLYHLIEAIEALIESGQIKLARHLADRVLEEFQQVRSIRRLRDWIVILHKSVRIGRELGIIDFPDRLFVGIESWYFVGILSFESQPVLSSYTYHFIKNNETIGLENLRQAIIPLQNKILESAREERSIILKILSLILAEASVDEIKTTAINSAWYRPWEYGLSSLLFTIIFPDCENPFKIPPINMQAEWEKFLLQDLSEHSGNLEFGLTLHLATITGLSSNLIENYQNIAIERAADEILSSTRWLLKQKLGEIDIDMPRYYIWTYLKNTVLKSSYLTWESDIEQAVDSIRFNKAYSRDIKPILTSD